MMVVCTSAQQGSAGGFSYVVGYIAGIDGNSGTAATPSILGSSSSEACTMELPAMAWT